MWSWGSCIWDRPILWCALLPAQKGRTCVAVTKGIAALVQAKQMEKSRVHLQDLTLPELLIIANARPDRPAVKLLPHFAESACAQEVRHLLLLATADSDGS